MHGLYLYKHFLHIILCFLRQTKFARRRIISVLFFFNRFTYKLAAKGAGYTSHEIEILPPPGWRIKKNFPFPGFFCSKDQVFFFFLFFFFEKLHTRNNQRSIIDRKCLCSSPTHSLKRSMLLFLLCGVVGTGKDLCIVI